MEMEGLERKAKASGASQLVVKDLKEEFVRDYIFPCLRAGATYERKYLLGTSMARPVIAKVIFVCILHVFVRIFWLWISFGCPSITITWIVSFCRCSTQKIRNCDK